MNIISKAAILINPGNNSEAQSIHTKGSLSIALSAAYGAHSVTKSHRNKQPAAERGLAQCYHGLQPASLRPKAASKGGPQGEGGGEAS